MPSQLKFYANKEKARIYRNKQRTINYNRGMFGEIGKKPRWTARDTELILSRIVGDRKLAEILQRSVRGIQTRRAKVFKILLLTHQV